MVWPWADTTNNNEWNYCISLVDRRDKKKEPISQSVRSARKVLRVATVFCASVIKP